MVPLLRSFPQSCIRRNSYSITDLLCILYYIHFIREASAHINYTPHARTAWSCELCSTNWIVLYVYMQLRKLMGDSTTQHVMSLPMFCATGALTWNALRPISARHVHHHTGSKQIIVSHRASNAYGTRTPEIAKVLPLLDYKLISHLLVRTNTISNSLISMQTSKLCASSLVQMLQSVTAFMCQLQVMLTGPTDNLSTRFMDIYAAYICAYCIFLHCSCQSYRAILTLPHINCINIGCSILWNARLLCIVRIKFARAFCYPQKLLQSNPNWCQPVNAVLPAN